jgi:hypothetical protein
MQHMERPTCPEGSTDQTSTTGQVWSTVFTGCQPVPSTQLTSSQEPVRIGGSRAIFGGVCNKLAAIEAGFYTRKVGGSSPSSPTVDDRLHVDDQRPLWRSGKEQLPSREWHFATIRARLEQASYAWNMRLSSVDAAVESASLMRMRAESAC